VQKKKICYKKNNIFGIFSSLFGSAEKTTETLWKRSFLEQWGTGCCLSLGRVGISRECGDSWAL
jgi:hypothetical protein